MFPFNQLDWCQIYLDIVAEQVQIYLDIVAEQVPSSSKSTPVSMSERGVPGPET